MAGEAELTVAYSVDPPGCAAGTVRLPQVTRRLTRDEVLLARGTADAFALRLRYHDAATHRRYPPEGETAMALFEAMETARCEARGAQAMPGTAGNIDAKIADEGRRLGYAEITDPAQAPLAQAAGYLVRHLATGRTLPAGAQNVMDLRRDFLDGQRRQHLRRPRRGARRPAGLRPLLPPGDRGPRLRRPARRRSRPRRRGRGRGGQRRRQRRAAGVRRRAPRTRASRTAPPRTPPSDQRTDPQDMQAALDAADDADLAEDIDVDETEAPERRPPPPHSEADPAYKVFLTRFDEEIAAEDLADPGRARAAARLSRPAARAAEGRGRPPRQPAAAPAAGAAEPRLGLRPRGRHPRRRPPRPRRGQPDDPAQLQDGARHRLPRHRGDAAPRQLRLDARPADLDRRDLGRRARPHPRALPGQGRDPRLHHPRLEGRPEPRGLARRAAPAPCPAASTTSATSSTSRPRRPGGAPARTSG